MRSILLFGRRNWQRSLRLVLLAPAALWLIPALHGAALAQHLPTGGTVVTPGTTIVQPNSTTLNINQSTNQAIINWNSFSVGRNDTVNFNQPSSASSTLNRVTGSTPSWIAGTINAPGTVLLINPNGIEITKSGVVNTGSFAASTLDISNSDYLSGNYNFTGNGRSAGVINNGRINVSDGGFAALLGGQATNNGVIAARLGFVALGAGEQATLDLSGDGFLSVAVPSSQLGNLVNANGALVTNKGKIIANGGTVFLSAATAANILRNAVNIPGSVQVNTVGVHSGKIVINGGGGRVSVTGRLAANGGKRHTGGTIAVSGGTINASGKLTANGTNGGTISLIAHNELALSGTLLAQGYGGQGGAVALTANNVTLTGATVNASGAGGGGSIDIGGGPHATVALADAQMLLIDSTSMLTANATGYGNGGHIVVWSDGLTTVGGTLSALGGPGGGNGGLIETSGQSVDLTGITVSASARNGTAGTWLLDPVDLIIDATLAGEIDATLNGGTGVTLQTSASGNPVTPYTLTAGEINNTTGNGDIFVNSAIFWTSSAPLTLSAYRNVNVYANITSTEGGAVTLYADNTGTGNGSVAFPNANTVSTSGAVSIFYNPAGNNNQTVNSTSYTTTPNYFTYVTGGASLTSYMLVNTVYDLQNIQNSPGFSYALGTNIDASATSTWNGGAGFVPIGLNGFNGKLNGQNYSISNLYINAPTSYSYAGLIGNLGGTISNLNLVNASVSASYPTIVGTLVGVNFGTISNVTASGTVTTSANAVGGLVGVVHASGSITNASSSVNVTGLEEVGGLIGNNLGGVVTNSSASGTVQGLTTVGGLIGYNTGTISNVFAHRQCHRHKRNRS